MKVRIKLNQYMTENGYWHIPLLWIAGGRDGFILTLPIICFEITWIKSKEEKP